MASLNVKREVYEAEYGTGALGVRNDHGTSPLAVGMLFSSYEELKIAIDEYQRQNSGFKLSVTGSRTIEACKNKVQAQAINHALKYSEITFACSECTKHKTWIKSVTENVQVNCEMSLRVAATRDGQHLEVRKLSEKHNHRTAGTGKGKTVVRPSPRKNVESQNNLCGQKRSRKISTNCDDDTYTNSPKRARGRLLMSSPDSVNLGTQKERWQTLKRQFNVNSDEEFIKVLLNCLEQTFRGQLAAQVDQMSGPSSGMPSAMIMSTSFVTKRSGNFFKEEPVDEDDHSSDLHERKYVPTIHTHEEDSRFNHYANSVSPALPHVKMEPQVITHIISDSEEDESSDVKPEITSDFEQNESPQFDGQMGNIDVKPPHELMAFIQRMEEEKKQKSHYKPQI